MKELPDVSRPRAQLEVFDSILTQVHPDLASFIYGPVQEHLC